MKFDNYHDQIHILNDNTTMLQIMRNIAAVQEDAFYAFQVGDLIDKHKQWEANLPRVTPYYAVKCNDHKLVLEIIAAMGLGFDCASKAEIKKVLEVGVQPDRIIFANPAKLPSHVRYAAATNVDLMTFDNESELYKMKTLFPTAKLVLRIRSDASEAQCPLGIKFGCNPVSEGPKLLRMARALRLDVVGISFHVGSGCSEPVAYRRAISSAKDLFDLGVALDFSMQILDIGGGFPGEKNSDFELVCNIINEALDEYFPREEGVHIIAEPGRYYVASAFTLVTYIHSKREVLDMKTKQPTSIMYYIDDGIYGSFNSILYDHARPVPEPLNDANADFMSCSIWGPTCDGLDMVIEDKELPILNIGDWIMFENMGAYTFAASSTFNGFPVPKVYVIMDEQTMVDLKDMQNRDDKPSGIRKFIADSKLPSEDIKIDEFLVSEVWDGGNNPKMLLRQILQLEDAAATVIPE